jgi:glutamate carboxypeptidase
MLSSAERDVLASIASQRTHLIETVQAWSAINTHSANLPGLATFAETLCTYAADVPLSKQAATAVQAVDARGETVALQHGDNLHATVRPEAPVQVLLTGHMDTVFPVTSAFQAPRWQDAATLNGPGVADMKGGLLVMLTALAAVEASGAAAQLGYQVVLNADEEISSLGSVALLTASAAKAKVGLVYEPSALPDGTLAGARKGIGSYTVVARGKAAHAGRNPEAGRNAIVAVADFFVRAAALTGKRDGLTVNAARIEGGGPTNVVPALAIGRFEVRVWTHEDRHWADAQLAALVTEIAARHDLQLVLTGAFNRPPKPMDPATLALFDAVRGCGAALGMTIGWQPSGGCCDGNNLAAAGLPVVDTLGVRGGAIHSDQEFMHADSLVERAQLSALLLLRLASGQIKTPPRISAS